MTAVVITPGIYGRQASEPHSTIATHRRSTTTISSQNIPLSNGLRGISILCLTSNARFVIGSGAQTANAATSPIIAKGERLILLVPIESPNIAVIRDTAETVDGTIEISELLA